MKYSKARMVWLGLTCCATLLGTGFAACGTHTKSIKRGVSALTLYGNSVELRFLSPEGAPKPALVVFATGDGGWRTLDREIFEWIHSLGYPVVGFSSPQYLKNLHHATDPTSPLRLAEDYEEIIQSSKAVLGLSPKTPTILAGLSRGAGLAVVAAGVGDIQSELAGVLAIALTKEEEHVFHFVSRHRDRRVQVQTYEYLAKLSSFPVAVIQSTHDHYLPAANARALFGPDTPLRQFHAIEASNHSFGGACEALLHETGESLKWILEKSGI